MDGSTTLNTAFIIGIFFILLPALAIVVLKKDFSLTPPPKRRDFGSSLAKWASEKGFKYNPQGATVVSGAYQNRWFSIHTVNAENALEIFMRIRNSPRYSLQIFGDWLDDSGVKAFINRFRIYSNPPGLSESLFEVGTSLRESLIGFPSLRARLELAFDPIHKDELRYSLLTDLPSSDTLDSIMNSMTLMCEAYEREHAQ